MTMQELKEATLKYVSADWVRENFGNLTLKSTWEDAYDRTREYAAAAKEQADQAMVMVDEVRHQAPIIIHELKVVTTELATAIDQSPVVQIARKAARVAVRGLILAVVFCAFVVQEWRQEGAITAVLAEVAALEALPSAPKYTIEVLQKCSVSMLRQMSQDESLPQGHKSQMIERSQEVIAA